MSPAYLETVRLLIEVAPDVFRPECFAMKGGTALNLFVCDMPRLSVDIDLVYTPRAVQRSEALAKIAKALGSVAKNLKKRGLKIQLGAMDEGDEVKLFVNRGAVVVKVEVNHVFRGTVLSPTTMRLAPAARTLLATDLTVPMLAVDELYGSKLVAALDRQHPRDFFDVMMMYANQGLTAEIVECFVVYLAGHNRPVHEVLFSTDKDMAPAFRNEFEGMPVQPTPLDDLVATRARLRRDMAANLTDAHRRFLVSLVKLEPAWDLLRCGHASELPALRWKLRNLEELKRKNPKKFLAQESLLMERFSGKS